jgi:ABC-type Fe3+ transport system permease subunit/streptogramin lyase
MNWLLLKNSLCVGLGTAILATGAGTLAALWVAGLPAQLRKWALGAAAAAFAMPPFVVTNCWLQFLGPGGSLRAWLPFDVVSLLGTVWILTLLMWPVSLFIGWSALRRLEPSLLEADLALRGGLLLRHLLLPLVRNAVLQAGAIVFVLALNQFAVPAILQVKTLPAEAWIRFNTNFDSAGALVASLPLIGAPLVLLLWLVRQEISWPRLAGPVSGSLFRSQLGRSLFVSAGILCCSLLCLSLGLPLAQLLLTRRTWTEWMSSLVAGQAALWNSFFYAAVSATLLCGVGLLGSAFLTGYRQSPEAKRFRIRTKAILLWIPFLVPGVLLGMTLIYVFNRDWLAAFYQSAGIVILAFLARYIGVAWLPVEQALQGADQDLTDAARMDGAGYWQMLRHVFWPQVAPQVLAVGYVLFLLCLWDVESMILVVPPGGETLALRIFNLLHYGHNAQVNALCLTLLLLALSPLVVYTLWMKIRPRGAFAAVLVLGSLGLFGCSPASSQRSAPLSSGLFSRVEVIGTRGVGVGQLNKPRSLVTDNGDNVYVADMTGRIQKFSPAGVFMLSWQMPQTDLGKPKGMGRDPGGNIIVIEPHYQRINHFSTNGTLLLQWGVRGTNDGSFILPRAVAVNRDGEIYVSEYTLRDRVQRFSPNGAKWLQSFGTPGTDPGQFNRPEGVCVDTQDRVYVADSCNHRIQVFDREGRFLRAYGKPGTGKGELSYPYDICVDTEGRQYVCEFGNSRIQVFDARDVPIEVIGEPGAAPGQFANPWAVTLDSSENLYVADSQNHRVQKFIRTRPIRRQLATPS